MEFNKSVSNPMLMGAIERMKVEDTPEHRNRFIGELEGKLSFTGDCRPGAHRGRGWGTGHCSRQQGAVSHADRRRGNAVFYGIYGYGGV